MYIYNVGSQREKSKLDFSFTQTESAIMVK